MEIIHANLSRREMEIYKLVAEGLTYREIAHKLTISFSTVKNHVSSILSELGMESRTEITRFFWAGGVILKPTQKETVANHDGYLQSMATCLDALDSVIAIANQSLTNTLKIDDKIKLIADLEMYEQYAVSKRKQLKSVSEDKDND